MDWKELTDFTGSLLRSVEPAERLWHYTDTLGLEGIIRNRSIRLSHPGFLNDPSELQYAGEVYSHTLSRLGGRGGLEGRFITGFREYEKTERSFAPFVASFCEDKDNLELWRQYGDDGQGFALGFRMHELQDRAKLQGQQMGVSDWIYVYKILYDESAQHGLASSILNFNFEEYRKICESGEGDNASAIEVVYGSLRTAFDFFIPFLKHPCYANERENRLVLHGHSVPRSKIQFQARQGYFKPYLDFRIAAESRDLPLDTVVLGPSTNSRRREQSVRMFLDRHELGDGQVAIERSSIPYLVSDRGGT
ncbi:MAG: DUF2971 domain-containing protein [Gemmatimonadaceae bacterium]|nr:DUF2971 domain-containing protein [Gemmatimonadaceae bacterium]